MSDEIAGSDNVWNPELEVQPDATATAAVNISGLGSNVQLVDLESAYENVLSAPTKSSYEKPKSKLAEKIIVWDTETTGTNPWDYRLIVASFWDLSRPIAEMVTFADFDEEQLTKDIAAYLNEQKPTKMICYNNGFDQRALLTRFMLYTVPCPGWNDIEQIDVMDILKKGTTKSIYSSQATGTEEQWFFYFFNEKKPYTIEECFEGVRNGDLERMVIRNRTCTASEGYLYLLFREVTDSDEPLQLERPTIAQTDEEQENKGICTLKCPACSAINTVPCSSTGNSCYRCLGALPDPTAKNIIKETLRDYDFTKVGLSEKKTTTTKKTTT